MNSKKPIVIVGGGLAGLTLAIDLAHRGIAVKLLERGNYPRHKVCGEYLSREVQPYLERLGVDLMDLQPAQISRLELAAPSGASMQSALPLGALGISRHALDLFLAEHARQLGVDMECNTRATQVVQAADTFTLSIAGREPLEASMVIGAYGKRSNLDRQLRRHFMRDPSPYLGIKRHFAAEWPEDMVQLSNFSGGYAGLSRVEQGSVNFCYLLHKKILDRYQSIEAVEKEYLPQQPQLRHFLARARPLWEKPLVISQLNFNTKPLVDRGIIMIGDAGGMIHPFCGNGMAMAMHSAQLLAAQIADFHAGRISHEGMLKAYRKHWQRAFSRRLFMGRQVSRLFGNASLSESSLRILRTAPALSRAVVRQTHGNFLA